MSRIDHIFARLRADGATALMPFVTAGHPTLAVTGQVVPALEHAGASIVEIGIPFSDPIADGPVIAASMHEALQSGVTPASVLDLVEKTIRPNTTMGLIGMLSYSLVEHAGPDAFVARAAAAGLDGLIVPDIDLDAAGSVRDACDAHDLAFALLVAPTTTGARLERITAMCTGFVYLLARVGITGERDESPEIDARVNEVRGVTDLPIAVGFGISRPEHVAAVTRSADAAIVGSALVRRMGAAKDPVEEATAFIAGLATACASHA